MSTELPDGPRWPAIAQGIAWVLAQGPFLERCRRRYGPTFTLRLPGMPPMVVLSDLVAVREVLNGDSRVFCAGLANAAIKPTAWLRSFGARSLLLLDGPKHTADRRLMMPAFHAERLEGYRRTVNERTADAIARWPIGQPFSLHESMLELMLEIVLETIFGLREGTRKEVLRDAFTELTTLGDHPGLQFFATKDGAFRGRAVFERILRTPRHRGFQRVIERVNAELRFELARHRAGNGRDDDVLSLLLGARTEDGFAATDESILDELKTLFLAAHETTATSLTWIIHELSHHASIAKKLATSLEYGEEYLDAVIRESLRRHPVVPMLPRVLRIGAHVGGREYPAGTLLAPSVQLAHHDEAVWNDPERFLPERFLGTRARPSATDLLSFGSGSRRCLGMAFALLVLRTVLRQIVLNGHLTLAPRRAADAVFGRKLWVIKGPGSDMKAESLSMP